MKANEEKDFWTEPGAKQKKSIDTEFSAALAIDC
jgi:hypothetical protein